MKPVLGNQRSTRPSERRGLAHQVPNLAELAEASGFTAAESDMFFTELVNDPHSLIRPYVMTSEGIPMPIGRQALGALNYFNQDDVRVKEDDVDEYVEMRAHVISAKPADDAPTVADANFVPDDFKPPPMSTSCLPTKPRTPPTGTSDPRPMGATHTEVTPVLSRPA